MSSEISWLHLTDLHYGSSGFTARWGSVRILMWQDLRNLIHKLDGELDLVLFTGDLTQCATPQQFDGLREFFGQLWAFFDKEGCHPKLFAVPGNHDLVRPIGTELKGIPYNLLKDSWLSAPTEF
jgi:3',5'-cyclic AMP phosphodiesterase CpdA